MNSIRIRVGAIIPKGKEFLFVKLIKDGNVFWLLPGGGLEFGETLAEGVIRELKEETNLDIKPYDIVYIRDRLGNNQHDLDIFFLAEITGGKLELGDDPDQTEHILDAAKWIPVDELDKLSFFPEDVIPLLREISSGNTVDAIHLATCDCSARRKLTRA